MFRAIFIFLLIAFPLSAEISGESDPRFQNSVTLWLEGDDMAAFKALRNLAYEGNTAAQIFLGRISDFQYSQTFFSQLDRSEVRQFIRAQGDAHGRFGRPWLAVASDKNPLARAFREVDFNRGIAAIPVLLKNGESDALLSPLIALLSQEGAVLETTLNKFRWPDDIAAYITWLGWEAQARAQLSELAQSDSDMSDTIEAMASLEQRNPENDENWIVVGPRFRELVNDENLRASATLRYAEIEEFKPFHHLCRTLCGQEPEDFGRCTMAIAVMTPYNAFSTTFGPVESLLNRERYISSPRFFADILAHVRRSPIPADWLRHLDQCLYSHVHGPDKAIWRAAQA